MRTGLQEWQMEAVMDAVRAGIYWVKDASGVYLDASEGFSAAAGRRRDELLGLRDRDLIWRARAAEFEEVAARAFARGGLPPMMDRIKTAEGVRQVLVQRQIIVLDGRRVLLGQAMDVTGCSMLHQTGRWDFLAQEFLVDDHRFSKAEVLLIRHFLRGLPGKAIAAAMAVHEKTVDYRLAALQERLGVFSRVELKGALFDMGLGYLAGAVLPEFVEKT